MFTRDEVLRDAVRRFVTTRAAKGEPVAHPASDVRAAVEAAVRKAIGLARSMEDIADDRHVFWHNEVDDIVTRAIAAGMGGK